MCVDVRPIAPDGERLALRERIELSLRKQGFDIQAGRVVIPADLDKADLRRLHSQAVAHRREQARSGLERHQKRLLGWIANGTEVHPDAVTPRLVEVERGSEEELLFRFVAVHWSIPVSSGYGRRLRFLVVDSANGKLMGIFGLGDPVFNLGVRDEWVGWDKKQRQTHLQHVMEAFVVGAVPPYSSLLGGKLVAMLIAAREVRRAFAKRYADKPALISGRALAGKLALVTTQSALGRSSIYNRVRYGERPLLEPLGYTAGYGEFHFANGLYGALSEYALKYCEPTAKAEAWGTGFRNRREVIKKSLVSLGLPTDWVHHGIRREVYAIPLAKRTREFLRGQTTRPGWLDLSTADLADHWRERWLLPRATRRDEYRAFCRDDYTLWR
jgi:Domain of unknown function (DUF4338)